MTNFEAGLNILAFVETNYVLSKSSRGDAKTKRKRHDLAEKKLQKARDK